MAHFFTIARALGDGVDIGFLPQGVTVLIQVGATDAIQAVVLEVAQRARTIDLGCQPGHIHLGTGRALIDRGFLAAFDAPEHVGDPLVLMEGDQRIQQPPFFEARGFVGELEFLRGFLRTGKEFGFHLALLRFALLGHTLVGGLLEVHVKIV